MNDSTKAGASAKASYHHGDLRAALIAEGLRLLEERDDPDLSLREIARATGVSATAVYRHFPDKEALREALAQEAYNRLGEAQQKAAIGKANVVEEFQAMGRTYVRFALDHPAFFRLMSSLPPHDLFALETEDDDHAGRLLRAYAAKLAGPDADLDAIKAIAMRSWALVHGLAVLMIDGYAPRDEALIDAVVNVRALGMGGDAQ
jgi:AcrR family transcriptional regulator